MARLVNSFNCANFDPSQGMGGLPVGEHLVVAFASEVKPTKGGDSGYLQLNLRVQEGPSQGSTGALRLNIYNSSDTAREIAERQLSAVGHAVGVINIEDSQQLHNLPFRVEVGMQKEPNPNKYTEIKRILCADGSEPSRNGNGGGNNGGNQNNGFNNQNQQNNQQQNQQQNNGNNGNQNNGNQNNGGNGGWGGNTNANNGNDGNQNGGWNNGNGNGNNGQDQNQNQNQNNNNGNQNQNNGNGGNNNNGNNNNNGGNNGNGGWAQNGNGGNDNGGGKPGWGR